ncbi:tRNA pseudouridine(55) synthase TruB [Methylophaga sp. OBS4]|uniref:tRNA pseudouridine(55) synthase TruB n=1 Tax=Methylophaga sp. OBS4 TaxID=2991935 RepID=UPI00225116E8|nr:tRNA pseudouridine(55) synthase TruB [Methylophaga sp. OBS4]MCX4187573.1 tRNA pseudouridine(55) synthase TruB [Methylophaga sp. OBS4]
MARRNKKGRDITGIVIVDKPTGHSSNHILQQVKRLFDAKKAGHTGSLDPLASGVLPVCLGEATKLSGYLLDADKQYQVTCKLGITTDSGDADGEVINETPVPDFSEQQLRDILSAFIGEQEQVPPMFSALKHQGQPLYKLARQGIEIERKSRRIHIYDITLLDVGKDGFTLSVRCSKGTYIRTLVEDISHQLGCGGHVTMLRRTAVAGYVLKDAITLDKLKALAEQDEQTSLDNTLVPAHEALPDWPVISLDEAMTKQLGFGQSVQTEQDFECANVRLFDYNGQFLGLGEMMPDGVVMPKRLFVNAVS